MKSSIIKSVLQYSLGLGLLAFILYWYWTPPPVQLKPEEQALGALAGGAAPAYLENKQISLGIRDLFTHPINVWPLVLACVLWVIALNITFIRWYVLVRAQDLPFTLYNAIRLGLVSYFFNTFLPGAVGGDIWKAVAVAREQSRRTVAVATIVVDRVIGLWALALFTALSGSFFWLIKDPVVTNNVALRTITQATSGIVAVSSIIWLLMGIFKAEKSEAIAIRLTKMPFVGKSLGELWRAANMYRQKSKAVLIAIGLSLVGHIGWVAIFHLCVLSFADMDVASLPEHMLIVPVGITAQALFPLPGGIGGGEAAYGWLYTRLEKPAISGVIGCLMMRAVAWGIGVIGYLVYTRMKKEIPMPSDLNSPST